MKASYIFSNYFPAYHKLFKKQQILEEAIRSSDVQKLIYKLHVNPIPFYDDIEVRVPSYGRALYEVGEENPILLKKFAYPDIQEHFVIKATPGSFFYQNEGHLHHLTSYKDVDHAMNFLDRYSIIVNARPVESALLKVQEND